MDVTLNRWSRCRRCGNGATADAPLEFGAAGELRHPNRDPSKPWIWICPPKPDGWQHCENCDTTCSPNELALADMHYEMRDELGPEGERLSDVVAYRPANAKFKPPPYWTRFDFGPEEGWGCDEEHEHWLCDKRLPAGVKGYITNRTESDLLAVVCQPCAVELRWPDGAWRPMAKNASAGATATAADDPLAKVPIDGPGLGIPALMTLWKLSDRKTRDLARQYVAAGQLTFEEKPTASGGAPVKLYRRAAE